MQQHPLAFAPQRLQSSGGVVQYEFQVRVLRPAGVDEPEFDVFRMQGLRSHPAQADDRVIVAGPCISSIAQGQARIVRVGGRLSDRQTWVRHSGDTRPPIPVVMTLCGGQVGQGH